VSESTLPPLHKAYLNIFFFGVRMLADYSLSTRRVVAEYSLMAL
jgi:hypothetical protein